MLKFPLELTVKNMVGRRSYIVIRLYCCKSTRNLIWIMLLIFKSLFVTFLRKNKLVLIVITALIPFIFFSNKKSKHGFSIQSWIERYVLVSISHGFWDAAVYMFWSGICLHFLSKEWRDSWHLSLLEDWSAWIILEICLDETSETSFITAGD